MSERTYFTTSWGIFAAPVTLSLQLFHSLHLCFQDFPTSNTSSCPTSIGVHTFFLLFFLHVPWVCSSMALQFPRVSATCAYDTSTSPALLLRTTHTQILSFFPSIISTSFNMKSSFQVRLIIFGSELEK